jgi:hypothetical protein
LVIAVVLLLLLGSAPVVVVGRLFMVLVLLGYGSASESGSGGMRESMEEDEGWHVDPTC